MSNNEQSDASPDYTLIANQCAVLRAAEINNRELFTLEADHRSLVFQLRYLRNELAWQLDCLCRKVCREGGRRFEEEFHITGQTYVVVFTQLQAAEAQLELLAVQTRPLKDLMRKIVDDLGAMVARLMAERGKDEVEGMMQLSCGQEDGSAGGLRM